MGVHIQPSPMPYQASKEGGRSRHGRTLRNGIAGPAAVVQPQRRQRHAESAARTSEWRCRAQAPRCRCARAARHRRPPSGGQDPPTGSRLERHVVNPSIAVPGRADRSRSFSSTILARAEDSRNNSRLVVPLSNTTDVAPSRNRSVPASSSSIFLSTTPAAASRSLPRQLLEMSAGLAEPHSAQRHLADHEHAPDEMIERDLSRDDVPATVSLTESDVVLALERFKRLGLDERDLASRGSRSRERTFGGSVAVALEALAVNRTSGVHRDYTASRRGREVDGYDISSVWHVDILRFAHFTIRHSGPRSGSPYDRRI